MAQKVFVGMSGGVDSSLTAALLKQQGYEVTGVYMKNWSQDLPGFNCPWKEDYQDAKRVAVSLGIDFKLYDFETDYRQLVVDYMIREYQAGRTPNPDIMCNQEVKFKLFLAAAQRDGAELIATGHYARIVNGQLLTGRDSNKDQSYFLYRVSEAALRCSLMPIGELSKPEVRARARQLGLSTADKKDSQGICFVGKVGIKEFLLHELGPQPAGPIVDSNGREVGVHDGAQFYTIGQRHGLNIGGGLPYYVVRKDMAANIVYVTTDLDARELWSQEVQLEALHWINNDGQAAAEQASGSQLEVRLRYRGPRVGCRLENGLLMLSEPQRGLAAGQSAVFYIDERVLGGGIIGSLGANPRTRTISRAGGKVVKRTKQQVFAQRP